MTFQKDALTYLSDNFNKMNCFLGSSIRKVRVLMSLMLPFAACHPAHKVTASKTVVHNELCAEAWLEYPNQPHPMWEEVKASSVNFNTGFTAPKKYAIYRTNADTLRHFFNASKNANGTYAIILPVTNGCEAFALHLSGVMSPALQAKYPDIISLQGNGVESKTADLRLDWNGTVARGQLTYNGAIYFLSPANTTDGIVYLMYNKDDAGEVKQPFETTPDNSPYPQMIKQEKTYDR